ncbi:MAG: RagB/SusD family nutrient uptake outer membrane protein [Odoribacter sp.]|nr:RagB/SusD family nutrient uptake outer membrane protein [Odoribacter sp.]
MKKKYLIIFKKILVLFLIVMQTGCNAWLNVYPKNQQSVDEFWQTGEEVQEMLMGTYVQLRACMQQFIRWGEIRGDGLDVVSTTSVEAKVKDMTQLQTDNSVCNWINIYNAINRANAVIMYGPDALETDITFSLAVCNSYIAEAIFIRSLCYFYLLRTFGDVPLITEPYMDDEQGFYTPVTDRHVVAQSIIKDLNEWVERCKPGYETEWENKGRATKWACYALLAEIYLWEGEFEKAVGACDKIIASGQFSLLPTEDWFGLYYPGNSQESIFELQWDYKQEQTSSFYSWFFNGTSNSTYIVSQTTRNLFEDASSTAVDIRGVGSTYLLETGYESKIWKYGGTDFLQ